MIRYDNSEPHGHFLGAASNSSQKALSETYDLPNPYLSQSSSFTNPVWDRFEALLIVSVQFIISVDFDIYRQPRNFKPEYED